MTDLRFPPTPGLEGAVRRVQRGYDNADKRDASRRSVHGGEISHLQVEVAAVRSQREHRTTTYVQCNDAPHKASAFAVYIRNPLALHIQDFRPAAWPSRDEPPSHKASLAAAKGRAFTYADALAEHLGCEVISQLDR